MYQEPDQFPAEEPEAPAETPEPQLEPVPEPEPEPAPPPAAQPEKKPRRHRGLFFGLGVLLLAGAAMAQPLRDRLLQAGRAGLAAVQTFASSTPEEAELTLPEIGIWALQLGVFDSGERAAQEQ